MMNFIDMVRFLVPFFGEFKDFHDFVDVISRSLNWRFQEEIERKILQYDSFSWLNFRMLQFYI